MARDQYIGLPKGRTLARVLDEHIERERDRNMWRWTVWNLAYYYLSGARRFDVFNPNTGQVRPHMLDEEGRMEIQWQGLLSTIDRVAGILANMDVRPRVVRKGTSLNSLRDRAVGQIISDAVVQPEQLEATHTKFAYTLSTLGCCGITGHIEDHPTIGLTADYEMVHPRELFCFPSVGFDFSKQRGLIRQRTVPLDWLSRQFGPKIKRNLQHMDWWEQTIGERIDEELHEDYAVPGGRINYNDGIGAGAEFTDDGTHGLVRLREFWQFGHRGLVTRYAITSGEYVIEDLDFEGLEVYCPIGVARFIENGTFYGAGLFDLLFSMNRQMEMLLKSLFNNIRDLDRYGVVVMPQGQFNERSALRDVGEGLRVLTWEPDVVDSGFRPFNITPFNSGDVPGKTAAFANDLIQQLSPWQDLLREKGRVDSAAGLGFLDEKNKQLMTTATRSVERAYSDAHRSVLRQATNELSRTRRAIPVETLTLDLAGAVIDQESGDVGFEKNPLPRIGHLSVTIRDRNPKSELVRKQEALQLFQMEGLNDPMRFILFALEEGLDFALYTGEEESAYQTIVRNCLLLYADGQYPEQQVVETPYMAAPELQLRVLQAFMSSPAMHMASPEVQVQFKRYREFLMESMGLVLPAAIPNPDELATLRMAAEEQQKEGGGPIPFPQGGVA